MKRLKRLIFLGLILQISCFGSYAQIMGSDMSWYCLGGDSFLINVTVYRDCNMQAPYSLNVNFKCNTSGTSITTLSLGVPTPVDVTPLCSSSCTRCQSSGCSFPYGINRYKYQGIVKLSSAGSCCSIKFSWQQSLRNYAINTGAALEVFYTEALMNRCQNPGDHSPDFNYSPIHIVCVGQDFSFDQGLFDSNVTSNGNRIDSFTFEWAQPLSAANTPISYTGSYSYTNPIYYWGFPNNATAIPRGFHLDPQTGEINFRPMKSEVTVMVVKINEFRNGTKIAEIRREIQIIVINCANNNPPQIKTPNSVRSKSVCAGDTITFEFSTYDPNANDTVFLSWNKSISGATWSDSNGLIKLSTGILSWRPNDAKVSTLPYNFTVTARDNVCPVKASFTQTYQITVKPKPKANIIVTDSGCGIFWFLAQRIQGSGPVYTWIGDSFTFSPKTGAVTTHKFPPGKHPYTMTMEASGCSNTYFDTVEADTFITNTLSKDTNVCYGSTIKINTTVKHNQGPVTMVWGSGPTKFNTDTGFSKTITITRDTMIWSLATDSAGCESKDSVQIKAHKLIGLNLGPDVRICSYGQADIMAGYMIDDGAVSSITWTDLKTSIVVDNDSMLSTTDSSRYKCMLIDTFGCTGSDTIRVIKNPEVIASAIDQIICYGDEAILEANPTGGGKALYLWYEGNVLIGGSRKMTVIPLVTTDYLLIVYESINGVICIDSTMVRVRVNLLPVIKIDSIDNRCLNGSVISLNNFVTVDGIYKTGGIWTSPSYGLIYGDKFKPVAAGVSSPPGWKVKYEFTDPLTGCYNRDSAYVTVLDIPKPYAGADDTICSGAKIVLTGLPELPPGIWTGTGVEGAYPNWKFNPDAPGIADSGTYDAIYHYTDSNNCENDDTIRFTVLKVPGAEAGSAVNFCFGTAPFTLTGVPSGGVWSGKGVAGSKFYPSIAGAGVHILRYSNSNSRCISVDSVAYTVISEIPTPQIIFNSGDSSLECSLEDGNYAWFYTPDTLSAPTTISSNTIKIDPKNHCKKCYFSVVFTDTNGCVSDTSAWYYFAVNSIDNPNNLSGFKFYPNPAHSELFIENPLNESAKLLLTDIFGKTLIEKKIIPGKSTLPLQTFKPGLYFIFMDGINAGKVLIE